MKTNDAQSRWTRRLLLSQAVWLSCMLAACGGGGGGEAAPESPAPAPVPAGMAIVSLAPAHKAVDVSTTASVAAEFTLPIQAGTVNPTNFSLKNGGQRIMVTYGVSGPVATMTPRSRLNLLTQYDITLGSIASTTGLVHAGGVASFTTRDGVWESAEAVSASLPTVGNADLPELAFDPLGNAFAVWHQYDRGNVRRDIWTNRFDVVSGKWGAPQKLETDNTGEAVEPRIAVGAFGTAVAVWKQHDGVRDNIWANRFSAGSWGAAQLIESDVGAAASPQVAMDSSGNAVAVWLQVDLSRVYKVHASRFDDATRTWSPVYKVENDSTGNADGLKVAINANTGDAIAVWLKDDGTFLSLWSSRWDAAGGVWSAPALLETSGAGNAFDPDIAMNGAGDAIVAWRQSDGMRYNLWARTYTAGAASWGTTVKMQADVDAARPRVALNNKGQSMVVWSRGGEPVWAASVPPERQTPSPRMIASGSNTTPRVAVDGRGHAIATWVDLSAPRTARMSRYNAFADTWSSPQSLATATDPASCIAVAGDGGALAVWVEYDGAVDMRYNIKAKRFK